MRRELQKNNREKSDIQSETLRLKNYSRSFQNLAHMSGRFSIFLMNAYFFQKIVQIYMTYARNQPLLTGQASTPIINIHPTLFL